MKFGIREAVDVVFKAQDDMTIGSKTFKQGQPVLYFDTLKTSTSETNAATVYAMGGKGNPRLIAWDGDKQQTFTFEDALISEEGMAILAGAGLFEAGEDGTNSILAHSKIKVTPDSNGVIDIKSGLFPHPNAENASNTDYAGAFNSNYQMWILELDDEGNIVGDAVKANTANVTGNVINVSNEGIEDYEKKTYLLDFYCDVASKMKEISIEASKFGGTFYVEGDTLFRDTKGTDYPAQLVFPKLKVQTAMNFSLSSTGDPSTFTFTGDAFPGVVNGGRANVKVLSAIHVIDIPAASIADSTDRAVQGPSKND